jgi:hypothetical protein
MSDEQRNQAPGFDITGMARKLAAEWLDELAVELDRVKDAGGEPEDALAPKLRDPIIAKCLLDPGNRHVNLEDAARNTLQVLQSTRDHAQVLSNLAASMAHEFYHLLVTDGQDVRAKQLLDDCKKVGILK